MRTRFWTVVLVLLAALASFWLKGAGTPAPELSTRASTAHVEGLDLSRVPRDQQPAVVAMMKRIDQGGPFAFAQDGSEFRNRERRLPVRPAGAWREYTVITPGASDRGARRLVVGVDGSVFYTFDHYDSFLRVRSPR